MHIYANSFRIKGDDGTPIASVFSTLSKEGHILRLEFARSQECELSPEAFITTALTAASKIIETNDPFAPDVITNVYDEYLGEEHTYIEVSDKLVKEDWVICAEDYCVTVKLYSLR